MQLREIVFFGVSLVAGPAAMAQTSRTDSLGRQAAIAAALAKNPQLLAGLEQVAQARARRAQGVAIPDPTANLEFDQSTGVFGSGQSHDKNLNATLTIPFPDKFRLRGRIGTADIRSTEASLLQLRQSIASQVAQTYDSVLLAIRHRQNLDEGRRLSAEFLKKTEARFAAGTTPKLDVVRARVDLAQAENDLIASERDVANAEASLNRLLARPLGAPVALADSLAVPEALPDPADLEAAAVVSRPDLIGVQRQLEGARAVTSLARQYWLPDLTVGFSKNYVDPGPGVLFTGVSMPLPIFFWQHNKGEIAESRHHERELAAGYQDLRAQVALEVRQAYAAAATSLRQAVFLRDQLLPAAREAFRIATVSYGLGGSSALEVLDARRALRDAENQFTDALASAGMTRAELERTVARPLASFGTGASHD